MKRKFKMLVIALVLVIAISCIRAIMRDPLEKVEKKLQTNREELYVVKDYLLECGFDSVTIHPQDVSEENVEMFTGRETGMVPIDNEEAEEAVRRLFRRGYRVIGKKNGGVSFLDWSIKDKGGGIIYSANGNIPDESMLNFVTEVVPLKEDKWYYYFEDFDEWKRQNAD